MKISMRGLNTELGWILTVTAAQAKWAFHLAAGRVPSALGLRVAVRKTLYRILGFAEVLAVTAIAIAIATRAVGARPIGGARFVLTPKE